MTTTHAGVLQLTVSQFADRLRTWLSRRPELRRIAIVGEISDWKPQANGNVYFNLKDDRALLSCFAYRSEARSLPQLRDGDAVVATGTIDIWERRSEYQLRVFEVSSFGVGAIAAKVESLRKRLQAEGMFDAARKRVSPRFPRRVALVSARGKGTADFRSTLRERAPQVMCIFVETRVQGEGAELDIADALERASRQDVDAVILLRGGGSYEDRYPFNTEVVVRAIVRCKHPVVTAIGHEGDRHLADEVADAVFKTPTAAAEYIAASWSEASGRLSNQVRRLAGAVERILGRASQRLDRSFGAVERGALRIVSDKRFSYAKSIATLDRRNPQRTLAEQRARLAAAAGRVDTAAARSMSRKAHRWGESRNALGRAATAMQTVSASRLQRALAALERCDPLSPLQRGYAIVTKGGRTVVDLATVRPGDIIAARLERGMLEARVESVMEDT